MQYRLSSFAALAACIVLPLRAEAQLTLLGQSAATGGGLGAVATVLTLQSSGNTTSESGCVAPDGTATCGFANVGVGTGASQTQIQPVSAFPGLTGSNFRLFLNAVEPGNDNTITVNNLVVRLYSSAGAQVFSSQNLPSPITLTNTLSGVGNFGFLFGLSGPDAAAFQTALTASPAASIGVGANITNASGGPETTSIGVGPGVTSVVPEPSTYLLMASGLGGLLLLRRKRMA
ncbi:MAG: PEP-CTERM sorting domain-containing protein [Gemmatimonadaceae bacterium]|nr:PEP-CTERM sorting domain-containing protein [Gemmatimonadaceae bacterium]